MPNRPRRQPAANRGRAARARQAAQARRRSTRRRHLAAAAAAAVVAAGALVIGLTVHGSAHPVTTRDAGDAGARRLPGVTATKAPWQPSYTELGARLAALRLPPVGEESYHIHAHLTVYVNGARVPVPTDIGIDEADGVVSPMHTHDTSGVIHIEAAHRSAAFTLGAFFAVWGVPFSGADLGAYSAHRSAVVQTYVNGRRIDHPAGYHLREHDNVVVGFGTPASFPRSVPFTWPEGE